MVMMSVVVEETVVIELWWGVVRSQFGGSWGYFLLVGLGV